MAKPEIEPSWAKVKARKMAFGTSATIPAKMIKETPLPIPRAVICSPIHINNMVPPVKVMTVEAINIGPGSITTPGELAKPLAMVKDWATANTTVR